MAKFKPFGLGGSMVSILFIIGKKKGINQKSIADALVLDQSTMSRDLKKLIERKYVLKRKGNDPRISELELTREGCVLLEEVSPIWNELHQKVQGILGDYNLQNIDHIVNAIEGSLEELKE